MAETHLVKAKQCKYVCFADNNNADNHCHVYQDTKNQNRP